MINQKKNKGKQKAVMQSTQASISNFLSDNSTSADLEHTQYIESDINQIEVILDLGFNCMRY